MRQEGTYYERNRERLLAHANARAARIRDMAAVEDVDGALIRRPRPENCDICAANKRLVFNHCHTTLKFRGWICYGCNIALGLVRDDPAILERMAAYLAK